MAAITLTNLFKSFGPVEVLKDINLSIADKEFCVLVGPSGCGKSTLLRMIAGLEEVQAGTIEIGGETVNDMRPRDRNLAMVFQGYALYPHKTVKENLSFSLKMHKYKKDEIETRVQKVAETLGLDVLLGRRPGQLSGGQRQRVAMGRAMVRDPSVFLFDEPLSNLDAKLRVQMRTEIRDLHQRIGATSVYVTHDQIEAMTMADRIVIMNNGVIEQVGPPLELFDNPANVFVATFLGAPSINLLEGKVVSDGEKLGVRLVDGSFISVPDIKSPLEDTSVLMGVRPHHLVVDPENGPIQATVKVVEPTGVETFVFSEFKGQEIACQVVRQAAPKQKDKIRLSPTKEGILLFDKTSGERVI
jgi:multiple sugar transport system ATP-binding protein